MIRKSSAVRQRQFLIFLLLVTLAPLGSGLLLGCKTADDIQKAMAAAGHPVINAVVPAQGKQGASVAVQGLNFGANPGDIGFQDPASGGRIPAKINTWTDTLIITEVPYIPGAPVKTQIGLRTSSGDVPSSFGQFTVTTQ